MYRRFYSNINILKYISAIIVVWTHAAQLIDFENPRWLEVVINTCVPFFFISSGFLMAKRATCAKEFSSYLLNKSAVFLRLWILWLLIYLPFDLLWYRHLGIALDGKFAFSWLIHALLYGMGHWSFPFWFIFSQTMACFLLSLATRKNIYIGIIITFILCSVIYIVADSIGKSYPLPGLFTWSEIDIPVMAWCMLAGTIFVSAGILAERLIRGNDNVLIIIGIGFAFIAIGTLMWHYDIILDTLLRVSGVVLIAVALPQIKIDTQSIQQQSIWIYYAHMYCLGIIGFLQLDNNKLLFMTLSMGLSIAAGWALTRISDTKRFQCLRQLIK